MTVKLIKECVIIGSGGFGREVLFLLQDINKSETQNTYYRILGFCNNEQVTYGTECNGVKILGDEIEVLKTYYNKTGQKLNVFLGIGNINLKKKIVDKIKDLAEFPTIVHPNVILDSLTTKIGQGCIITANNIITCNIILKDFITCNLSCTIGHDCIIENYSILSPGVNLSGNCYIGEGVYLGTNSTILEKKTIGKNSIVGAGAVVTKDVPENCVFVGNPAKELKRV